MAEQTPLRALIIEDSDDDALLLLHELRRQYAVTATRVDSLQVLEEVFDQVAWDVVISDYAMPGFSGKAALDYIRSRNRDLPFILISGTISEDAAVEAIKAGANDYFAKDKISRLLPVVERELRDAEARRQRAQLEEQLRRTKHSFATIFHANPIASTLTTIDRGTLVDVNDRFLELFGYQRDEVIGRTTRELNLYVDTDRDEFVAQLLNGDTVYNKEMAYRTRSGDLLATLVSLEIIDYGGTLHILSMVNDISERKAWEKALLASEQRFRALTEKSYDGITLMDTQGKFLYMSPSGESILGHAHEDIVGTHAIKLVHPEDTDVVRATFQSLAQRPGQSEIHTYRARHKNGAWRWLEAIATNLLDDPAVGAIVGNFRDVTDRKRIEDAIRESDRFARNTVNALSAHIAILDENGVIVAVNDAWRQFAQVNSPDGGDVRAFEGVNYLEVSQNASGQDAEYGWALARGIRRVLDGDIQTFALPYPCHSPTEQRWFQCRVTRFSGSGPARIVVAHENISEQKAAEHELALLYNATSVLFEAETLDDLGRRVVEVIVREMGSINCCLLLVQPEARRAVTVAVAGPMHVAVGGPVLLDGRGLIAQALRSGSVVYAPDVTAESNYWNAYPATRTELVIPLVGSRGVMGALDLQSDWPAAFSERDRRIMLAFAERVTATLETMLLHNEINKYAAELETRVAERTAELHQAMERVEVVLNNAGDAIILSDVSGTIGQTNPAFMGMFGYPPEATEIGPLGRHFELEDPTELNKVLRDVTASGEPARVEQVGRRLDGTTFDVDVAIAPVTDYKRRESGVVLSLRDITLRKHIEENLRLALARERELSELKSRFTSMVSHEFRNPLAVIQSAVDLMSHYGDRLNDERKREQMEEISLQVRRLTDLLEDILTVTRAQGRGQEVRPQSITLQSFIEEIVREARLTAQGLEIGLEFVGSPLTIMADPKLLRQAVGNLLSNAVKYSPEGGRVHVQVERQPDQIFFRVTDQGIGIPPEDVAHLFDVFHRARNVGSISGTGLGLAIVKEAAKVQQGDVFVESTLGVGSTFTLVLPVDVQPVQIPH